MTWCNRIQKMLSAYHDRELQPAQRRCVEEHLASCSTCSKLNDELWRLRRLTVQLPEEEPSPTLEDRILTALAVAAREPARPALPGRHFSLAAWRLAWAPAALAGAAVLIGHVATRDTLPPATPRPAAAFAPESAPAEPLVTVRTPPAPSPAPRVAVEPAPEPAAVAGPAAPVRPPVSVAPPPRQAAVPLTARRSPAALRNEAPAHGRTAIAPSAPRNTADARELPAAVPATPQILPQPVEPSPAPVAESTAPQPVLASGSEAGESGMMRVAGMSGLPGMDGTALPPGEEDGLTALRMFLQERNMQVPQPPSSRDRRSRKL